MRLPMGKRLSAAELLGETRSPQRTTVRIERESNSVAARMRSSARTAAGIS